MRALVSTTPEAIEAAISAGFRTVDGKTYSNPGARLEFGRDFLTGALEELASRADASARPLTKRQAEVLAWIRDFITARGYAPTLQEIATAFRFGSLATAAGHVSNLIQKGHLRRRVANSARNLELVRAGEPAPGAHHG